jgi:hypothetical protein
MSECCNHHLSTEQLLYELLENMIHNSILLLVPFPRVTMVILISLYMW